jgi:hypothetical protein
MPDPVLMTERELLDRREAIRRVSLMLGGVALVGGDALLKAVPDRTRASSLFPADDVALLDEVAETILPATRTPGAKAAKTGAFMALMVQDSYDADKQRIFRDGIAKIDDATRAAHGVDFMAATPAQRLAVLKVIDKEQQEYSGAREEEHRVKSLAYLDDPKLSADLPPQATPHYFRLMKELALLGYFTSEIGCTQAQRYIEAPGRFDPCVPYTPGERAWAPHA